MDEFVDGIMQVPGITELQFDGRPLTKVRIKYFSPLTVVVSMWATLAHYGPVAPCLKTSWKLISFLFSLVGMSFLCEGSAAESFRLLVPRQH